MSYPTWSRLFDKNILADGLQAGVKLHGTSCSWASIVMWFVATYSLSTSRINYRYTFLSFELSFLNHFWGNLFLETVTRVPEFLVASCLNTNTRLVMRLCIARAPQNAIAVSLSVHADWSVLRSCLQFVLMLMSIGFRGGMQLVYS